MTPADVALLAGPEALAALATAPDDLPADRLALRWARQEGLPPARLLTAALRGRRKLAAKVPAWRERDLLACPTAVQQCSSQATASHRSRLLQDQPLAILDGACGLGVDALWLAAAGHRVTALDRDAGLIALLRHNAARLGLAVTAVVGDLDTQLDELLPGIDLVLLDPDRRPSGDRVRRLADCSPTPAPLLRRLRQAGVASLWKLAPGCDQRELAATLSGAASWELLSVGGEARELVVACPPRPVAEPLRRAIVLDPSGQERHRLTITGQPPATCGPPGGWLGRPDVAIRLLDGVDSCAVASGCRRLAPGVDLLTADRPPPDFPGRGCHLLGHGRWQRHTVRGWLRDQGIRHANITSVNGPLDATTLAKQTGLKAGGTHDLYAWRDDQGQQWWACGRRDG